MDEIGVKHDGDKPRWGLLPWDQLEQVVDILTFGSKKYSDDNWKHVDDARERYFDAMIRHIADYRLARERNDPSLKLDDESGKNHLAHAMCNALFLMWFDDQDDVDKDELLKYNIEDLLSGESLEDYITRNTKHARAVVVGVDEATNSENTDIKFKACDVPNKCSLTTEPLDAPVNELPKESDWYARLIKSFDMIDKEDL